MGTSTSLAQDVITCDLCDKPIQQFCNSCQVSLCETCVKKHRDEFKSLMHEIVPFRCRLTTGIGKLMDKVRVIATIPTPCIPLLSVACVGESEAWIYGDNETITRIDIHGAVKDTFTTKCLCWPSGISVTRGRELMYSDDNSRTLHIVRDGKSETLITTPQGWTPEALCCTKSGDVLVHVYKGSDPQTKTKVIRYQGQNIKQEISNDGQENSIFKDVFYSLFMSENNNGDVCVSYADAVIVVDKTGRVRFRYDGTPARKEESFDPRCIVTDALSQIIVTDLNNNCLHILDQNGQFLRCVDNCGLQEPMGLSVDSEGRLWVGSFGSGEIKVIEYL
uniref:Tripartite motif-containing protein 2-like n=1 Tax=Crassostrea virginica TaxID=6565 RepID=A0A8B8AJC7_CRAVI|nr:tripartite motif-containing protein 2-like [Crassostrea virginica]